MMDEKKTEKIGSEVHGTYTCPGATGRIMSLVDYSEISG